VQALLRSTVLLVALFSASVEAGTQALREVKFDFMQIASLAKGVERSLAARRARVALIGRVGLNPKLLPPGVTFSHAGLAVYSRIKTADGRFIPGYAVYNLYQGDERTGRSFLTQDYPVDYLAVSQVLEVGIVIPSKKLQRALARTIFSDTYAHLHNPRYSVLSNPFNNEFQNCTEFVLDVLFASIYRTDNPRQLKVNIEAYFNPQPIVVDQKILGLAAMTMPDVTTEDHSGPLVTATFSSIARFLIENGMAEDSFKYVVDPHTRYGRIETIELQANGQNP